MRPVGRTTLPTLRRMPNDTHFVSAASWRSWFTTSGAARGPGWLPWAWTLVFSALIAVGFTILGFVLHGGGEGAWRNWRGWLQWYGINLVISLCVGVAIRLLFMALLPLLGAERLRRLSHLQRALFFSSVPLLGVALGGPVGLWLTGTGNIWIDLRDGNSIAATVLLSLLISTIFYLIFNAKARQLQAEQRASEAQLRLLQGQIEPHFLFNTLANVQALIDPDPAKARQMLESFTDYLRSSLTTLRHDQATLGSELDLARTYLCLLKTRMEDRLQFSIDDAPALRDVRLPPLLLQPLVENAIHHGLEPKVEGGRVTMQARAENDQLLIEVADDGLGQNAARQRRSRGAGVALDNLRERLAAQFGPAASLTLIDNQPGTRAVIRLPLQRLP
jgi:two-component sensor histidine kinase